MSLNHPKTTLVAVIQAWICLLHKRLVMRDAYPPMTYGMMLARDRERVSNLSFMYTTNNVEVIQMLQMRRAPFYELV
jgi:hypothetical protein